MIPMLEVLFKSGSIRRWEVPVQEENTVLQETDILLELDAEQAQESGLRVVSSHWQTTNTYTSDGLGKLAQLVTDWVATVVTGKEVEKIASVKYEGSTIYIHVRNNFINLSRLHAEASVYADLDPEHGLLPTIAQTAVAIEQAWGVVHKSSDDEIIEKLGITDELLQQAWNLLDAQDKETQIKTYEEEQAEGNDGKEEDGEDEDLADELFDEAFNDLNDE